MVQDNKCIEIYQFLAAPEDPQNHFVSSIKRTCSGRIEKQATFEFWHKTRPDGVKYLERMRVQDNTKVNPKKIHQVNYDPYTGGVNVVE